MDFPPPSKPALRRRLAQERLALSAAEHAALSLDLCGHLAAWLRARDTTQVFLYYPVRGEPDLRPLRALLPGPTFALPVAGDAGAMTFHAWVESAPLIANRYGIPEPRPDARVPPLLPGAGSVVLTPCLALDARGVRLGYGGGFYDRFLRQAGPAAVAVAVLFEAFLTERLPAEAHDVLVPLVATERGVRRVGTPATKG